jgi:PAS domain S-box-containing protein
MQVGWKDRSESAMPHRTRIAGGAGRLQWFLESVPEALLVVDRSGRIKLANAWSAEVFGYALEELIGLEVEMLLPAHLRERHTHLRELYNAEPHDRPMGATLDIVARRRDGSEFSADVELRVRQMEGQPVVFASVRERVAGRSEERRQQRLRDFRRLVRLTRLTVEDVEEMVAVILGDADRVLAGSLPAGEALAEIRHAASVAAGLAEQLLGYVDEFEAHIDAVPEPAPEREGR